MPFFRAVEKALVHSDYNIHEFFSLGRICCGPFVPELVLGDKFSVIVFKTLARLGYLGLRIVLMLKDMG